MIDETTSVISEYRKYQLLVARIERESGQDVVELCQRLHNIIPFNVSAWYQCYKELMTMGFEKPYAMQFMWEMGRNYMGPDHALKVARDLYSKSRGLHNS